MNISSKIVSRRSLVDKGTKAVFVATIVASVVLSFSIVMFRTFSEQRAYNSKVIAGKEKARDNLLVNEKAAKKLSLDFIELEKNPLANSKLALNALPTKYDFPAVAASVEKIIIDGGYKLESFRGEDIIENSQDSSSPKPKEIAFQVEISGNYESIKKFTDDMLRSIRPFKITKMEVSGVDNKMTANYKITTYYQNPVVLEFPTKVVK
jgi:Tfp pilus assembly protein PilO